MCSSAAVHRWKVISSRSTAIACGEQFHCVRAYSSVNGALETQGTSPNQGIPTKRDHLVAVLDSQRARAANTVASVVKPRGWPL